MKALLCAVGVWGLSAQAADRYSPSPAEIAAAQSIRPEVLRSKIRFLASDLLAGRAPATQGDALAQQYLASQFEGLGLQPGAADGTYFQPFELVGIKGHAESVRFARGARTLDLKHLEDTVLVAGKPETQSRLDSAEVVFVGYGIVAPEFHWDDFKGQDLHGKVLLVLNNDPEDDPALFEGKRRLWYGRWDYKFEQAAKAGAAGALIVHTPASAGYPWQVVQTSWGGEQFDLPGEGGAMAAKGWLTEDATRKLLQLSGQDWAALVKRAQGRDFQPVPLGVTVSTSFRSTVRTVRTANVLAKLPGSDPKRREEAVVYTAHYDHLGSRQATKPGEDVIYNGAEDNASGVAQMLGVARAFAQLPKTPPRTILFAAVAAEEQGLLGSEYLAMHPPIPVGKMAADINIDGGNIFGHTRDVTVLGLGKTTLDPLLAAVAKRQGRELKPDAFPDRGFFYRSDQFNFAKVGVPAVHMTGGTDYPGHPAGWGKAQLEAWEARDYHQPSDELTDAWDFAGLVEDAQLYFWVGALIAREPTLPGWKPGDEFESARKANP